MQALRPEIPLLGKRIREEAAEAYHARIKALYSTKEKTDVVDGVRISFGEKVTQVRVSRTPKYVTRGEAKKLAEVHKQSEEFILSLFTKRKIEVRD